MVNVCKSFGDIGNNLQMAVYQSSSTNVLIVVGGQKVFYMIPTIRKVSFFYLSCQLGQKRDIQCQERLYVCDEESSSQATQWVEFFSKGAFQLLWTCLTI